MENTRLYFDAQQICLGSYEYQGDYHGSDFFALPEGFDPKGKTLTEIRAAQSEAFRLKAIQQAMSRTREQIKNAETQGSDEAIARLEARHNRQRETLGKVTGQPRRAIRRRKAD